jgi:hypothetical protein
MRTLGLFVASLGCVCASAAQAANIGSNSAMSRPAGVMATGGPLPDLAFSFVSVQKTTYYVSGAPRSIVLTEVPAAGQGGACTQPYAFPLQLIVKNIGQADFVPKNSFQAVGVNVGPWNSATDLVTLHKGASQVMNFNVSLAPGKYLLQARIDLHNGVAEARSDNDTLNWPLEVRCDTRAAARAPIPRPALATGAVGKRQPAGR